MIAYLTGEILRLIHQLEIDVFLSAERREKMERELARLLERRERCLPQVSPKKDGAERDGATTERNYEGK